MATVSEGRRGVRRGGLGRGLSALLPGAGDETGLLEIPLAAITPNPRQPRTSFNEDTLAALARSIQEVGVLQPVVVRRREDGYELVAGERRLRAAAAAGLATIPAVVRETDDADALREALIENVHRENPGPIELAEAFSELLDDLGATHEELAGRLGLSRPHVANTIRLLQLPADVQRLLAERKLQAGHARALLGLPDAGAQSSLALRAVAEDLSVREVEAIVKVYEPSNDDRAAPPARRARRRTASYTEVEERLGDRLGTRVRIQAGRRRGRIVIDFSSREDLERIVDLVTRSR
jgi:ParB family chromosome partitioning protein